MKRRILAALVLAAAVSGAHGDDPAKPPPGDQPGSGKPPTGQPPTGKPPGGPPPDPVKEQAFQDKAAWDALELVRKPDVADVMEGLDRLSKLHSGKATSAVIDAVLPRTERHVAEFAGFALSCADPQGTLKELTARLADPKTIHNDQLEQMASLLMEIPAADADNLLANERFIRSADEGVRRTAIQALGWHRSPLGLMAAENALTSKDAATRNIACVALGRIGDKSAVPPLLQLLDEKDGGTGGFAAIALGRIEDDTVFNEIVARMQGANSIDKGKALVACARPKHAERLVAMVKNGGSESKIAACAALGKIKNQALDTQKQLLDTMFGDTDRWVRVAAFHALGQCCTPELAPILAKRMGQQDDEKLRYLYEIAGDVAAKECAGPISDAMWEAKNDLLRRVAADSFWRIHDAASVAATEKKIRAATGRNFERAMVDVLSLRRNRNGFDLALELLPLAKGHDQFLVEMALEKQTGHFFGGDAQTWKDWIDKNPKFFEKEQAAIERAKWRDDFLKENSSGGTVTPATEEAVQAALDYLARHQNPDGAFDQQTFLHLCAKPGCPNTAGARIQHDDCGMTALCALSYYGAGCGPSKGRYRGVLARAMEFLLSRQMPNGDYDSNDLIGGYNRPLVLQAYSEAAMASVESQEFLPFVQRGVDFIACIQAEKGGWRYRVVDNANDTSVVAWVLFASKAAEKAHAHVRRSIYEGADIVLAHDQTRPVTEVEDFVHDIDPRYAYDVGLHHEHYEFHTGYQDDKFVKNRATTAIGLMSRILLGYRRSHPFCIGSANTILNLQLPMLAPKKPGEWDNVDFQYPMYTLYYCTLSMHQMGGKYFSQWDKAVRDLLPSTQTKTGCARGSWASWGLDTDFSRLYTTAMGALTLETYYRYAPILQD